MSDRSVEAHLRAAVESAPSGLLMADADGRIVLVNREIERMFGYAREELLGQRIEQLVPDRFRAGHPGSRAGFRADPRVRAMGAGRDLFGLRKDGTDVPIEIGLTPLATEDGLFVLAAVVDISARKQLEAEQRTLNERLRQAQKMEAVGTLAGGIAHDFNNILGGIVAYAELLAARIAPDTPEGADLQEILSAAMRGRRLVERILTFSRRQESERKPVDLAEIVREVRHLLRATIPATITMDVHVTEELPQVVADSTSVHQVLMNLASNASQAMPHGGTLELSVAPFYVRDSIARANPGLREGPYLSLDVRDSGMGMDAETRARAFEPFFTTKPSGSGTGLGLAMVHGIMQDHGGAVLLESAPAAGTRVRCLFPVPAEAQRRSAAREPVSELSKGHGERVLLIDDEERLLEATARRLEMLGYVVQRSNRPADALALFHADPAAFDLVITDLSMPGMSGIDLGGRIHAMRADLPIILLSGFVDDATRQSLRASGISMMLHKPVVQAELAKACRAALDRVPPEAQP